MSAKPKTLQQAIIYFADADNCLRFMVKLRWPDGRVVCPTCGREDAVFLQNQRKWQCKSVHAKRQFSVKVGTILEDSPIGLDKWLIAIWMVSNCKNGVSSYEIGRALGVTQKSAWFMLHRIRLAMQNRSFLKLGGPDGEVEVDETFVGGAARFMHADKHKRRITETGTKDKTAVMGILERGGEVRAAVVGNRKKHALQSNIRAHVKAGSAIYTDALMSGSSLAGLVSEVYYRPYAPPRKCCKQKTYGLTKPFRCNTYKKQGVASFKAKYFSLSPPFRLVPVNLPSSVRS